MAQNFCTKCGAPVVQSQSFCTKCGAHVAMTGPMANNVPRGSGRLDGFDTPAAGDWETFSEQPVHYDNPVPYREPARRYTQAIPSAPPEYPPEPPNKVNPIVIAIIAGLLIILLAVGFALFQRQSAESSPASSSSAQVEETSSSSETESTAQSATESSSEEISSAQSQDDEEELYAELVGIYDAMGTQADRIKSVATTLNNTIFVSDKQARQSASREAHDLFDEVDAQLERLKTLKSNSSSTRYASDIDTLIDLQQDLYNRIDVMCQAWDISLSYSNPKNHEAAIKKPLGKDNDSNGVNIYKKDFESRYPGAHPTR